MINMKRLIYILAAALCCSCTIMDGGWSGRDRESLMTYAQKMYNICIMTPAALAERIVDGQDPEIEMTQGLQETSCTYSEISADEWMFTTRFGAREFSTHVIWLGKNDKERHMFQVSAEGMDRSWIETLHGTSEVTSVFEFPSGHVTITDPIHPLVLGIYDFWGRSTGEGSVSLMIYREDSIIDEITMTLGENGTEVTL